MSFPPGAANHFKLAGEFHLLHLIIVFLAAKLTILSLTRDSVNANYILLVFFLNIFPLSTPVNAIALWN